MGLADVAQEVARPRKRMRVDNLPKDKFNISNDQFYEVSKEGGRHRVRQTFGQLVVEHAYPAQKLQLPFVRLIPTLYLVYLFNSSNLVQNSLVETRGAVIPSSRSPISFEYRDSFQQSADSEKEEGQGCRLLSKNLDFLCCLCTEVLTTITTTNHRKRSSN